MHHNSLPDLRRSYPQAHLLVRCFRRWDEYVDERHAYYQNVEVATVHYMYKSLSKCFYRWTDQVVASNVLANAVHHFHFSVKHRYFIKLRENRDLCVRQRKYRSERERVR